MLFFEELFNWFTARNQITSCSSPHRTSNLTDNQEEDESKMNTEMKIRYM